MIQSVCERNTTRFRNAKVQGMKLITNVAYNTTYFET